MSSMTNLALPEVILIHCPTAPRPCSWCMPRLPFPRPNLVLEFALFSVPRFCSSSGCLTLVHRPGFFPHAAAPQCGFCLLGALLPCFSASFLLFDRGLLACCTTCRLQPAAGSAPLTPPPPREDFPRDLSLCLFQSIKHCPGSGGLPRLFCSPRLSLPPDVKQNTASSMAWHVTHTLGDAEVSPGTHTT